jgi:hypothetical protein
MNCAFDKEKLTGYYDGELEAAEKAEVERHIASCSECLRELGELKSAAILVKELPRLRAPRSVAEGVSREIQAAGKVHSFAKFRRTLLWGSAAAAALFVGLNVMYFTQNHSESPAASVPPVARMVASKNEAPPKPQADSSAARRAERPVEELDRAPDERRKSVASGVEMKEKARVADASKKLDETAQAGAREREKAAIPLVTKSAEKPAAEPLPAPSLPPPAPVAAPKPPGAALAKDAKEEAKLAPAAPTDKSPVMKKDGENAGKFDDEQQKVKRGLGSDPQADAGPAHLTLASTQMSKSRSQMEETLTKMGIPLPPSPRMLKGSKGFSSDLETSFPLELTDSQIARLKRELEKPGSSTIVAGKPDDPPVLRQFGRGGGGAAGAKKEGATVAGAAPAKKPADSAKTETSKTDSKDSKDKDGKDAEDAGVVAKAAAESAVEKGGEVRRKIVLHLLEVPSLSDAPAAADSLKK